MALSTAEAEYMAMSAALQEVKWVAALLKELRFEVASPMPLFTDNQAAVSISSNEAVPHNRTKHIDIRHHYVREQVREGVVAIKWISTADQLADVFTKGLSKETYKRLTAHIIKSKHTSEKQEHQNVRNNYLNSN